MWGTKLNIEELCFPKYQQHPCGEVPLGTETPRSAMVLPQPQSWLIAELVFIHKLEQEMCQESTLFYFSLSTANILRSMKTKESEICLTFKNPAIFRKNPWVTGFLLYHQIRKEECFPFGETEASINEPISPMLQRCVPASMHWWCKPQMVKCPVCFRGPALDVPFSKKGKKH